MQQFDYKKNNLWLLQRSMVQECDATMMLKEPLVGTQICNSGQR